MGDIVSRDMFDHLLDHMLEIHRKKLNIISAYTRDYDSYTSKLNFLNAYIKEIETYLETASVGNGRSELPFVILGSVVEVQKADTNERIKVRIVLPKEPTVPDGENAETHTCFSDFGGALLLKRVGDHVEAEPDTAKYHIIKIRHDHSGQTETKLVH